MVKEKFFTANELAKMLGYNVVYLRRLIKSGKIHGEKMPLSGQWRVSIREVRKLMPQGQEAQL